MQADVLELLVKVLCIAFVIVLCIALVIVLCIAMVIVLCITFVIVLCIAFVIRCALRRLCGSLRCATQRNMHEKKSGCENKRRLAKRANTNKDQSVQTQTKINASEQREEVSP